MTKKIFYFSEPHKISEETYLTYKRAEDSFRQLDRHVWCLSALATTIIENSVQFVKMGDTKSCAKYPHVAFSSVFIGFFQFFGTKCGSFLGYWELLSSPVTFSG